LREIAQDRVQYTGSGVVSEPSMVRFGENDPGRADARRVQPGGGVDLPREGGDGGLAGRSGHGDDRIRLRCVAARRSGRARGAGRHADDRYGKIADFGIRRRTDTATAPALTADALAKAAPSAFDSGQRDEQVAGRDLAGIRCDAGKFAPRRPSRRLQMIVRQNPANAYCPVNIRFEFLMPVYLSIRHEQGIIAISELRRQSEKRRARLMIAHHRRGVDAGGRACPCLLPVSARR
jgi:hypothetical protein